MSQKDERQRGRAAFFLREARRDDGKRGPGHPGIYPWEEWLSYPQIVLVRGVHYQGRTYALAQQLRNAARRYMVKVSISIALDEGSLTVARKDLLGNERTG